MKHFLKEHFIQILFVLLTGLLLVLWGRILLFEFSECVATMNLRTVEDRVRCAKSYGWQVDSTSETKEKIYIPKEFDDVYNRYNELQKICGFDLTKFQGKGVIKYTFRVTNFPGTEDAEAFLNLLVHEDALIGGDCMTVALDGMMLPLCRKHLP